MKTKAVVFTGLGRVAIEEVSVPEPEPGEVLIKTSYSCVSPGAEMRCLSGRQPSSPDFPFIPGYALSGIVVARGEGTSLLEGTRVFCTGTSAASLSRCWGGHIGYAVRSEDQVVPVPSGVSLREAPLARLVAIALHGFRLASPKPGDNVVVVGLGAIGLLAARLHALHGANVIGIDRIAEHVGLLERSGVTALRWAESSLVSLVRPRFRSGADIIVDVTGETSVLSEAVQLAKIVPWDDLDTNGARYVLQGSYTGDVPLPYQAAFVNEVTFLVPRDAQRQDLQAALALMATGTLRINDLAGEVRSASEATAVYALLEDRVAAPMTVLFDWSRV